MLVNKLQLKIRYSNCARINIRVAGAGIGVRFMFSNIYKNFHHIHKNKPLFLTNNLKKEMNFSIAAVRNEDATSVFFQNSCHRPFGNYLNVKSGQSHWLFVKIPKCRCDPTDNFFSGYDKLKCILNTTHCELLLKNCEIAIGGFLSHHGQEPKIAENFDYLQALDKIPSLDQKIFKRVIRLLIHHRYDLQGNCREQYMIPYKTENDIIIPLARLTDFRLIDSPLLHEQNEIINNLLSWIKNA